MKRLVSLTILLTALLSSTIAFAAENREITVDGMIDSFVHDDDTLYYMSNSNHQVFALTLTDQEPTSIGQGGEALVVIQGNLYTLDADTETLRMIVQKNHQHAVNGVRLPITSALGGKDGWNIENMQDTPDGLYFLLYVDDDTDIPILCRYDWAQGTASSRKCGALHTYCYAGADQLYIIEREEQGRKVSRYNWSTKESAFIAYAPQGTNGFVYHQDRLFGSASGDIYQLTDDGYFTLSVKSPMGTDSRFAGCIMHEDWYVSALMSRIVFWNIHQAANASTSLTVLGASENTGYTAFLFEHPEVTVSFEQLDSDPMQLMQRMMTGELAFDVMKVTSNQLDIQRLATKGYLEDLTADSYLLQEVLSMYPAIQNAVMLANHLYAVPCDVTMDRGISYNDYNWRNAGLTDEQLPHSFLELFQFAQHDFSDLADDYALFPSGIDVHERFLDELLYMRIAENTQLGQSIRFSTAEFQALLLQLEAEIAIMTKAKTTPAFFRFGDVASLLPGNGRMLPLSLDGNTAPMIPAKISFYIVNPMSANKDMALAYIHSCVEAASGTIKLLLYPSAHDPIYSAYYLAEKPRLEAEAASLQSQINQLADDADQRALQEALALNQAAQAELDNANYKYDVSPDDIRSYQQDIAPYLFIRGALMHQIYTSDGSVFDTAIRQYLDHQMSIDQLLMELDRICSMIEMESE